MPEADFTVEVGDAHVAQVGHIQVRRSLPRHGRRNVGAWCFADHMGPLSVTATSGLDIGPHPHCGLQTVTWLTAGEALHHDSLGTEQLIRPGQLNLMTAGHGVVHAEEATGQYEGRLEGIQLWIAQPDATRDGPAQFEHLPTLPRVDFGHGVATVLVGEFAGIASPARHDTPLVGVDLELRGRVEVPLRADFEYALIVMSGGVDVAGSLDSEGQIGYLGLGHDSLALEAPEGAHGVLLGGTPFETPFMWWNFVARSREEAEAAYESWVRPDGRFGEVKRLLAPVMTPPPYWRTLGQARS